MLELEVALHWNRHQHFTFFHSSPSSSHLIVALFLSEKIFTTASSHPDTYEQGRLTLILKWKESLTGLGFCQVLLVRNQSNPCMQHFWVMVQTITDRCSAACDTSHFRINFPDMSLDESQRQPRLITW